MTQNRINHMCVYAYANIIDIIDDSFSRLHFFYIGDTVSIFEFFFQFWNYDKGNKNNGIDVGCRHIR